MIDCLNSTKGWYPVKRMFGLTLSLFTVVGLLIGTTGCPENKKTTTTDKKTTTETKTPGGSEKKTEETKTQETKKGS